MPGVPAKPQPPNFYPAGATKDGGRGLDRRTCPRPKRARAAGSSRPSGAAPTAGFIAVPYSVEYQGELARAARCCAKRRALTTQPTLKAFLTTRADALPLATTTTRATWPGWSSTRRIEPTIGPYEVYEDEWFNYKAAFEAFITVRDDAETQKLGASAPSCRTLENAPADRCRRYRNPALGALAPIRVVNVVFAAGDGNRGVQTAAFNLPNDERVVKEKGTKRVMLKNMQEAKFDRSCMPIRSVALPPPTQRNVAVRRLLHAHPDARADARPRARTTSRWAAARRPCARS